MSSLLYLEGLFGGLLAGHHAEAAVGALLDDLVHDDLHELGQLLAAQFVLAGRGGRGQRRRAFEFEITRQSLGARGERDTVTVVVVFARGLRRVVRLKNHQQITLEINLFAQSKY